MRPGRIWLAALLACAAACSSDSGSGVSGPPDDQGIPTPPSDPPPTGNKWQGVEVEGACGRLGIAWVLVDEVCGGTDDPGYLDYFRAPMFRDGARIGDLMYSVDGTHLWVLDIDDASAIERQLLLGGLGEPLAVATHEGRLLIAAGSAGLLLLDLSEPLAPTIAAQIALSGPALDVHVSGDSAYVTAGGAGLAVVDLLAPGLDRMVAVPGFAAAVAVDQGLAYVAACDTLAVIDLATDALLGQGWLSGAYDGEFLVAPAKDVAIVGDVAFVAAGRFGAVAVDVTFPSLPTVIGNCTLQSDMKFYASGVRAEGDKLFVAAGEWGVMPLDVQAPFTTCPKKIPPILPELPDTSGEGECSTEPPWNVVPWTDVFEPPPPGQDPIQTLPFGDIVYAFGDARRVGIRAIDVRDATAPALDKIGRYDEPRVVTGIAAAGDRVVLIGPAGGVYLPGQTALLQPVQAGDVFANGVAAAMLDDGRWAVATDQGELVVEGMESPLALPEKVWSNGLTAMGSALAVPTAEGAVVYDVDAGTTASLSSGAEAALPQAIAFWGADLVVASPEWTEARLVGAGPVAAHGVFDLADVSIRLAIDAARDPKNPEPRAWALAQAAELFWHEGNLDEAERGYALALETLPDYGPAIVGMAQIALARGRSADAIAALTPLAKTSASPRVLWLLADAQRAAGNPERAREAEMELERRGRAGDPRTLAMFWASRGEHLEEALQLVEREAAHRHGLYTLDAQAWVLHRLGRTEEARRLSARVREIDTPDAQLLYHAGAIRVAAGDQHEGRELVERALSTNPYFDEAEDARRLLRTSNPS
jgi:tetratricopeptide (TPR) repeat protein